MPKSVAAVLDEHVELLERALVEQKLDALARGELAALVLRLDARLAAARAAPARAGASSLLEHVLHESARSSIHPVGHSMSWKTVHSSATSAGSDQTAGCTGACLFKDRSAKAAPIITMPPTRTLKAFGPRIENHWV